MRQRQDEWKTSEEQVRGRADCDTLINHPVFILPAFYDNIFFGLFGVSAIPNISRLVASYSTTRDIDVGGGSVKQGVFLREDYGQATKVTKSYTRVLCVPFSSC